MINLEIYHLTICMHVSMHVCMYVRMYVYMYEHILNLRTQKASTAFGKLEKRVWSDRGITIKTKISVYSTCILTALLYSSECWTTHQRHLKQLERFHQKCLRRILNIKWQSLTPDTAILQIAESPSIESLIMKNQLRWAVHVVRMEDERIPKQLFYGELMTRKCPQHKPKKRFKDCINLCRPHTIPGIAMVHYYFIDNSQTMYTRKEIINQYNP